MKKFLSLCLLAAVVLGAGAQRTIRGKLRAADRSQITADSVRAHLDTVVVAPGEHLLDINGYDKPLRSRRETFFATNNSDRAVAALAFTITYLDGSNRKMHAASHHSATSIPARETRQLSLRSWDVQNAFFYRRSTVPQRADQATPYDVRISVDTVFYVR